MNAVLLLVGSFGAAGVFICSHKAEGGCKLFTHFCLPQQCVPNTHDMRSPGSLLISYLFQIQNITHPFRHSCIWKDRCSFLPLPTMGENCSPTSTITDAWCHMTVKVQCLLFQCAYCMMLSKARLLLFGRAELYVTIFNPSKIKDISAGGWCEVKQTLGLFLFKLRYKPS